MKTINVTSKTSMNVPSRFTMKELYDANKASFPETSYEKAYPTLNARVKSLMKKGEIVEASSLKTVEGRGRVAIVYALKDASLNPKDKSDPLYIAKKQGRETLVQKVDGVLVPVAKVTTTETTTTEVPTGSPVEAVSVTDTTAEATPSTVDVPVEVVADSVVPTETVAEATTATV